MKLLFDQNISFRVVGLLKELFPEAKHVKEFDLQFNLPQTDISWISPKRMDMTS